MLGIAVLTVLVSIVAQASSIVGNLLQFDSIYEQLYPILNAFHLYVLFYIISNLQNIRQLLPSKNDNGYLVFRVKLKQWIKDHFGKIYWKERDQADKDGKKEEGLDLYVDVLTTKTNRNILKTHRYFMGVFVCYVLLYIIELINSLTFDVNEATLHILTIILNNIATLYWFYIYLTFNTYETIRVKKNKNATDFNYKISKKLYGCWKFFALGKMFDYPDKFEKHEDKENEYESIEIYKIFNWKSFGVVVLIISIAAFIFFIYHFSGELEIEKASKGLYYYLFRGLSTLSVLLGGCAMLATFSRLSSGFKKVPLTAFLVMLFYAAIQPLFFAGSEFDSLGMKMGQMMFIANLLCLLGKFGLLYLIKWFFSNYHIAYYFIAEQVVKDKKNDLKLNDLFCMDKKCKNTPSAGE